jgi:hypothetical protein
MEVLIIEMMVVVVMKTEMHKKTSMEDFKVIIKMLHVTRHTSHVTRHMSNAKRHTSQVRSHTSHVTLQLIKLLPFALCESEAYGGDMVCSSRTCDRRRRRLLSNTATEGSGS